MVASPTYSARSSPAGISAIGITYTDICIGARCSCNLSPIGHELFLSEGLSLKSSTIFSTIGLSYCSASCECRCICDIKHDPTGKLYRCQASTNVGRRAPYELSSGFLFFLFRWATTTAFTAQITSNKNRRIIPVSTLSRIIIVVLASVSKYISNAIDWVITSTVV